jgi:hypothetical protein
MPTSRRKPTTSATKRGAKATRSVGEPGIVLAGPPGQLRATVSVENAVDQRVTVRGLVLHREGEAPVSAPATALIPPGATAEVPVTFRLNPTTAPGEHTAEVEVGGVRRSALIHVEPDLSVRVSPRRILAAPGRQAVSLLVVNDGNLDLPLAPITRARTDDGGPDPGPDVVLEVADPPTVRPGTTATVSGHLDVPADLDPTRRHIARIPVGTADLEVIVLPRTASETPS